MKIKTILALMFFVTTNVIAQKEKPIYSYVEQRTFLETQKIDFVDNRIIVVVQIDGENYNFIVDTGAPTALDNKLVKKLNLTPRRIVEAGTGGVQKDSVGLYILPSLKIKEIEFVNTLFSSVDLGFLSKCGQIDGILGANIMVNCVWQIDIPKKTNHFFKQYKKTFKS
ncbi:retropepsin-like aspartic protease [Flavobacterium sp.]|uniref:retropepsin-like aspartic protease n=1 Tax=Flavobacterium sp. TaxID=239 RepID=UPI0025C236B1|nr:retropepsin-like aspartic protease [Flavobacterium sp.]